MLYNALHIGDHLISVAGIPIKTSNDVSKAIRAFNGQYVCELNKLNNFLYCFLLIIFVRWNLL